MRITVKERVLAKLAENKNIYYSGQELADEFGVTRAAVWKAIDALRAAGYAIQGTNNRGYCIADESDVIDTANVTAALSEDARLFYEIHCVSSTASTNLDVRNAAMDGALEGYVMIAEEQTKGRGRMGRSFLSPKGSGIYLSVLLRPEFPAQEAVQITVAAAAAAAQAVEKACSSIPKDSIRIKWVNDLYYQDKKICGILTEAALSVECTHLEYAVLGIGFNISDPDGGWPEELRDIAGSLNAVSSGTDDISNAVPAAARVHIAAEFLNYFLPMYRGLTTHAHLAEYRRRQMLSSQAVEIFSTAPVTKDKLAGGDIAHGIPATVIDVDDECRLIVRMDETGEIRALNSGEVRVRKTI